MTPNKALNLRLPEDKVAELAAIAFADHVHISDAIREAIDSHIAARRAAMDCKEKGGRKRRPKPERGASPSPGATA